MTNEQLLKMCRWDEINANTLVCKPSDAFWVEWRRDKWSIKALGVDCRRLGADFVATWTHNGSVKRDPVAAERAAAVRWSAEQEAIFAWFKEGKGNLLVRARAGTGKCLGPEVPVLMHDGSIKRNGDVRVGDMLMGPDGSPRRVLSVTSGVGPMYRIRPVRGDAWTCNDAHVLTLVGTNRVNGIIRDVPLNVFLAETADLANVSRDWKLFRPSLLEFAPQAPPPVDPYFLGLWIGDGTKSLHGAAISKPDPEVRQTCCGVADAWGLSIRESNSSTGACPTYHLTAGNGPGNPRVGKNQLLAAMRKLLGEFARIPNCVRMGSVETRLSFLAGVLDSDGHLAGSNTIELAQKRVDYAEDIAFIARSLGFFVSIREKFVGGRPYQRMFVSGDCARIPMRLPRKKAAPRRQVKNPLRIGFEVEPLGEGEYFGFTLDGDGRFLLGDFTVTHNTATLKEAFKHAPEKVMLYAVFNKRNQVEASEKIRDTRVSVRTLHSLGYAFIKAHWQEAKLDNAVEFDRAREAAPNASDSAISCVRELVGLAKNRFVAPTVAQLAQLAEDEDCVPEDGDRFGVADVAVAAFDALRLSTTPDELNRISFDDMVWLPVAAGWVRPWFDLVAIDEAQDMNALQLTMAMASVKPGGRVVVVGDDRQCVISGTQIATPGGARPVEAIARGDEVASGIGRSRLCAKTVSDAFCRKVENEDVVTIETESGETLTSTPQHLLFAGFDIHRTPALWVVYLMHREDRGFRVGISQTAVTANAFLFRSRLNQERGDAMWILHTTASEQEARFLEQKYSTVYGLPTRIFFTEKRGPALRVTDTEIVRLFSEVDTRSGAERLLRGLGMSFEYPHVTPKCSQSNRGHPTPRKRRNFSITLCADCRGHAVLHAGAVSIASREDCARLKKCGIQTRADGKRRTGYRSTRASKDLADIYEQLNHARACFPVNVIETARLCEGRALPFCPAGHVRAGMVVFIERGGKVEKSRVTRVSRSKYSGKVYDLNVSDTHNYVAGGILVHNCIYGFRGAVQDGLEKTKRELKAAELTLTETFRCPQLVVDMAREIVPDYRAHESNARGIVDLARAADLVSLVGPGNAILSRTNAPLAALCMTLLRNGKAAKIEGKDVGRMLVNVVKRLKARSVPHFVERLAAWSERRIARIPDDDKKAARAAEIEDLVETLAAVADGAANVAAIVDRINSMFVDEAGKLRCVVLSTVHKAKGLEWPHVYTLDWTFKMKDPSERTEEANIRYVAITRTKEHLTLVQDDGTVK